MKVDETEVTIESPKDGSHYKIPKDAPDEIFVQGKLNSGAVVSANFRRIPFGLRTVDNNGLRWVITGTEGEIELTTPEFSKSYSILLEL